MLNTPKRFISCSILFFNSDLIDDNITDDVKCVLTIYKEHEGLSGNGFNAWLVHIPFLAFVLLFILLACLILFAITFPPLCDNIECQSCNVTLISLRT